MQTVALPAVLTPSSDLLLERQWPAEALEQVQPLLDRIADLLRPLALIKTPAQLSTTLDERSHEFWRLKAALADLLSPLITAPEEFLGAVNQLVDIARAKGSQYLPKPSHARFLSALESLVGLASATFQPALEGNWKIINLLTECASNLTKFDMVTTALLLVILDNISQWEPRSLSLLCRAADDYMTEVEDVFLAAYAEPQPA